MSSKKKSAPLYQLPAEGLLKSLLRRCKKAYKDVRGIVSEKGAAIANATEHDHLHKGAFAVCERLERLTDEKLAEWKAHFDDYFVKMGLEDRVNSVERLPLGDDADKQKPSGKVVPLQQAAE